MSTSFAVPFKSTVTNAVIAPIAVFAVLTASGLANGGTPKKCVGENGAVTYSQDVSCGGGKRDRVDGGTFNTVREGGIYRQTTVPSAEVILKPPITGTADSRIVPEAQK